MAGVSSLITCSQAFPEGTTPWAERVSPAEAVCSLAEGKEYARHKIKASLYAR